MAMKRVLDNALILYGDDLEVVSGHVVIKDGLIDSVEEGSYIGPKEDMKRGVICPGLTNSHVHLGDAAGLDAGAYLPLGERVGKHGLKWGLHKDSMANEAIAAALDFMKRSGTTAFCDFREGGIDGINQLNNLLNMQARILGRPLGEEDIMEHCDGLGISSITDYDEGALKKILSHRAGKLVGVHAGEVTDDVPEALRINPDFLVHLTNAENNSLDALFKNKVPIVLCPRANASFGVGIPPLKRIFNGQSLVALGTDNVMANPPDMLREMEFTWKLYRGLYKDHEFDAKTVLKAATINGRRLLKLSDNAIKEGNPADFIITRGLAHSLDPVLAMVHRTGISDIREVVTPFAGV